MAVSIASGSVIVPASSLTIYKRLDEQTVVTVCGDRIAVWDIEGEDALQLICMASGSSGMNADQMIAKVWP